MTPKQSNVEGVEDRQQVLKSKTFHLKINVEEFCEIKLKN